MKVRLVALAAAVSLVAVAPATATTSGTESGLRVAVTRLLSAELAGDGATACSILYAPLAGTVGGRTCAQRWDARIARLLSRRGGAARVRSDLRAVPSAAVRTSGLYATIALPNPLLDGTSRFYWTANCWMLTTK